MTRQMRRGPASPNTLALLALLAPLALFATACSSMDGQFPAEPSAPTTLDAVAEASLLTEPSWEPIPLQLRTGADIAMMAVVEDTIYVVDTAGTAHAINSATGTHRWIVKLDRMPTRQIMVGPGHVGFLAKNHLTVATRASGTVVLRKALEFTPSSSGALTGDSMYSGAWGNGTRLRSVSISDGWHGWYYKTDGPVTSTPIVVGTGADQMVYFASEDSQVVALPPRSAAGAPPRVANWAVRTLGRNTADLAADNDSIYVASEDHALYCMNRNSGAIRWKWMDGHTALHQRPVVTADTVYQPFGGMLAALDKATGEERYRAVGGQRFLTRIGQRDYIKLAGDAVAVYDVETGDKLTMLHSPLLDYLPTNAAGGALIFSDGRNIYSLK